MHELTAEVSGLTNELNLDQFKRGSLIELRICDLAYGGKGIAKIETPEGNYIVFVPNTIPGQLVKAKILKKGKSHAECRLIKLIEKSPVEIELNYQPVSGAPYASLPIELQHFYKKRNALDQYSRLAEIEDIQSKFDEFIDSPDLWNYRNKMQYSFSAILWNIGEDQSSDGFGLGSKKRGVWWAVENLDRPSGIFDEEFESILKEIRYYLNDTNLPAYHYVRNEGFYRMLQVQKSFFENKLLLNLNTTSDSIKKFDSAAFHNFLHKLLPDRLAGMIHTINDDIGDRMNNKPSDVISVHGDSHITEMINGLKFRIDPSSFFQTNPKSAELLYDKVISYVFEEEVSGTVIDLFCGTGTIAQLIAKKHPNHQVIGVELIEQAVKNARDNAKINGIENVLFYAEDVGKFLKSNSEYQGQIDVLVMDPPRGGMSRKAIRAALRLEANRVVYVSCNPATQARDIKHFNEFHYEMLKISLVDQFPHTSHIESVVLFKKKDRSFDRSLQV